MNEHDLEFMKHAVDLADQCHPVEDKIPRVGAVIVSGGEIIGSGCRGNDCANDDKHAELRAIESVAPEMRSKLAGSTLYTTLEPCTPESRSIGEKCCSELIFHHRFGKVFVGIPDPNPDVTGKGLLRLLNGNVNVELFPHELSQRIKGQNAAFIAAQQTWGAKIISPKAGDYLRSYESGGRHPIRIESINAPGDCDYLWVSRDGHYSPMPGPFRHIERRTWEVDAYFRAPGHHSLCLVRVNSLGRAFMDYYWKIIGQLERQRFVLKGKIDLDLLGEFFPPIEMNGLQKGLRLEHSVPVFVGPKLELRSVEVMPTVVKRGGVLNITYHIESADKIPSGAWLGASFNDSSTQKFFNDGPEDRRVPLEKGANISHRQFQIAPDVTIGEHSLRTNLWMDYSKEKRAEKVADSKPTNFKVIE